MLVANQNTSHGALRQEVDDDKLEVVGLNYLVKSGRSCEFSSFCVEFACSPVSKIFSGDLTGGGGGAGQKSSGV